MEEIKNELLEKYNRTKIKIVENIDVFLYPFGKREKIGDYFYLCVADINNEFLLIQAILCFENENMFKTLTQ